MGWFGLGWVGAVIGLVAWWLRPDRTDHPVWWSVLIGAIVAVLAKMCGTVVGAFADGDTLEWLSAVVVAMIAVAWIPGRVVKLVDRSRTSS